MLDDKKCLARRERNSIALIFHSRKLPFAARAFPLKRVKETERIKERKREGEKFD